MNCIVGNTRIGMASVWIGIH